MSSEDNEGWVYCISNESMLGLLKIGMTDRTPQQRLAEANRSDTWRPPNNYVIEFAKKVKNALKKEKTIHKLLEEYNERVNVSREFFRITTTKARLYFDLMDGEYWEPSSEPDPKDKVKRGGGQRKRVIKEEKLEEEKPKPVSKKQEKDNISEASEKSKKIEEKPKTKRIEKNIRPYQIKLENISEKESLKLLELAQEMEALEIKVNNKYYLYDDILKGNVTKLLYPNMVFRPILKSSDDADRIISTSNLQTTINKLKRCAPSTFVYAEEILSDSSKDLEINNTVFNKFINASVRDLSIEESKLLISAAINMESLTVKTSKKFHRFTDLKSIKASIVNNTVYEAQIVPAPRGYASVDLDCSIYINTINFDSMLKILKDKSNKHILVLSELCKM
jgi:hypothetical protein